VKKILTLSKCDNIPSLTVNNLISTRISQVSLTFKFQSQNGHDENQTGCPINVKLLNV